MDGTLSRISKGMEPTGGIPLVSRVSNKEIENVR